MFDWQSTKWGSVATLVYGKALTGYDRESDSGPVRVYGTNGPIGWHVDAMHPGGRVIIGRKGAYRGVHFAAGPFWVIDTAYYLDHDGEIDARWAYYSLTNTDINGLGSGSAIPSTAREDFYALTVSVPRLDEQRAISEVLGALDDKIAANANLVTAAEALMRSIAASTSELTTVSQIAKQITKQLKPESFVDDVAHFSLPAFDEGSPELTAGSSIMSNKFAFEQPAVLMSKLNPRIPRLWNIPVRPDQMALASTEFVVLAPQGVGVSTLWSVLAQRDVWTRLKGKVAGTSGSHQRVKPAEIMSLTVRDPRSLPHVRQHSLETLGLRCHASREGSRRLAAVRDALLPGLMSGRIRVKDAERVVGEAV
ncbi:MAG: restriction endonuclease subunit S [Intrasporangium sp.]|uniref:restriction endonuclease subunit S n=1 Tax=Intrasporangium sp. TaxID=1925024 RepID=UPI00264881C2|nr:restriction endonuclease subunit S [Intrasporangium sp.]MDN5796948.1 restriction endonuclease subunit S [Intrasporangium sp.]